MVCCAVYCGLFRDSVNEDASPFAKAMADSVTAVLANTSISEKLLQVKKDERNTFSYKITAANT